MTRNTGGAKAHGNRIAIIGAISFFHLFLTFALSWTKVQDAYYWIDTGRDAPPSSATTRALRRVLPQPAQYITRRLSLQQRPAVASSLALANSLLWGAAGYTGLSGATSLLKRIAQKRLR